MGNGPGFDVNAAFADAQKRQQAGDFAGDREAYRTILQFAPTHAGSIHFMGVAAAQQGHMDEGLALVRRSLELAPNEPSFHRNYFSILRAALKSDEALAAARRAVELDKTFVDGLLFVADAMLDCRRFDQAAEAFARALAVQPDLHDARNSLAYALRQGGKLREAAEVLRQAVRARPDNADLYSNLGTVLMELGELEQAEASCRRALEIKPGMAAAHSNLGSVLFRRKKFDEAIEPLRRAVEIKSDFPEAWHMLGCTLWELEHLQEACDALAQAVARKPNYVEAHANWGRVLRQGGKLDEALAKYGQALAIAPSDAAAHFSRALLLLQLGRFEEGWAEYEWRWQYGVTNPRRGLTQERWDGGDLAGRTILLTHEQGIGDVIQFARYAPLLAARGGKVVLECPKSLVRLAATVHGADSVLAAGQPLPPFDTHCPLLSVPGLLGTTLENIPRDVPYFHPAPADVAAWAARLAADGRLRVGIAWAGNPLTKTARLKRVALEMIKPILQVAGVAFYSLQVDAEPDETAALAQTGERGLAQAGVQDLAPHLTDFAQTAGAICNLDLVICVDTAVAHLTGALANPVWVMLPFAADWRWLVGRDDSPWYPTMRLFRQAAPGDWDGVIARVRAALDGRIV